MQIIDVTPGNLAREHICCAISGSKDNACATAKKAWMQARFADGLVFKKLDVRGKVFIEYLPAENAWCPLSANGYLFINCLWVSGQFKGQGYADQLLSACIAEAKTQNKIGLTVLSSRKKQPFLSDPDYLKYKGFRVADTTPPDYELLYLPFSDDAPPPQFKDCVKQPGIAQSGWVLYYTDQCQHTSKYAPLIHDLATQQGVTLQLEKIETMAQAQNAPAPFTAYSLFHNGKFITHEILSAAKFQKLLDDF